MVVLDVETTGLSPERHSIVSIGAVDFKNPKRQFSIDCQIFKGADINVDALDINGFTLKQITDPKKPTLIEATKRFMEWFKNCQDKTIAGHNPKFDRDFLLAAMRRAGITISIDHRTVDLHTVCYHHYISRLLDPPLKNNRSALSSDAVLNYTGLPSEPKPHIALIGAKMEAEAFSRFFYGKPMFQGFLEYPIPHYLRKWGAEAALTASKHPGATA